MSVTTPTTTTEEQGIENYTDVIHALVRHQWKEPEGEMKRVEVDDPRSLDKWNDPEYLRVSLARKGFTFRVIETAEEFGLKVGDVWQTEQDKQDDRIMLKLEEDN